MTSSRKRHQHHHRLIDGCFHKNFETHVSNILLNKKKHSAFTQTIFFLFWWRYHARTINIIAHRWLLHVSSNILYRQRKLVFKETETSLFWRFNHAINISVIISFFHIRITVTVVTHGFVWDDLIKSRGKKNLSFLCNLFWVHFLVKKDIIVVPDEIHMSLLN